MSLAISSEVFLQSRAIAPSKGQRGFVGFGDPSNAGEDFAALRTSARAALGTNSAYCEAVRRQAEAFMERHPLGEIRPAIETIAREYGATPGDVVLGNAFTDDTVEARTDMNQYRIVSSAPMACCPARCPACRDLRSSPRSARPRVRTLSSTPPRS